MLAGFAGTGKDTIADYLVSKYRYSRRALATPAKKLVQPLFAFSDAQLWGPSELREREDERYQHEEAWAHADERMARMVESVSVYLAYWSGRSQDTVARALLSWWWDMRYSKEPLTPRRVLQTFATELGREKLDAQVWVRPLMHDAARAEAPVVVTDARFTNEFVAGVERGWLLWQVVRPGCGPREHASEVDQGGEVLRRLRDVCLPNDGTLQDLHARVDRLLTPPGGADSPSEPALKAP